MISYRPLWKTMKEKNISQYYLLQNGVDSKTLDSLRKNRNITALTIEKLCSIIDCTPNDIIEFIPEEKK
ncbi:MAG: helix-turn-helix transcriptional regulator [Erysipelotrichaceae bacterium]|nr:helix-turn-helix transcriptional regulator [Erysipelotrichaceae bacterium]